MNEGECLCPCRMQAALTGQPARRSRLPYRSYDQIPYVLCAMFESDSSAYGDPPARGDASSCRSAVCGDSRVCQVSQASGTAHGATQINHSHRTMNCPMIVANCWFPLASLIWILISQARATWLGTWGIYIIYTMSWDEEYTVHETTGRNGKRWRKEPTTRVESTVLDAKAVETSAS